MYSIYSLIGGALGHIVLVLTSNIGDMLGWFYSICCGIVIQIICKDFIPEAINLDKSNGKQIFSISFALGMFFIAITLVTEGL